MGYNVFLLRQYFLTLRESGSGAQVDGAGPLRRSVSAAGMAGDHRGGAVPLLFTWNDFFAPLVYLSGHPKAHETVGLQRSSRACTPALAVGT